METLIRITIGIYLAGIVICALAIVRPSKKPVNSRKHTAVRELLRNGGLR
jgi:uncharacterized protein YpmB